MATPIDSAADLGLDRVVRSKHVARHHSCQLTPSTRARSRRHEKPRVTRFQIDWTSHSGVATNEAAGGAAVGADNMAMKQEAEAAMAMADDGMEMS